MRMAKVKETTTVITLDEENDLATILTYSKKWQRYLEKVMGLTPVYILTTGSKFYELGKKFINLPEL